MKRIKKTGIFLLLVSLFVFTAAKSFKNSPFFEIAKQIEIFTTLYKQVHMNYVDETNPAHLMTTGINAMLEELDPYTRYYNEQDVQDARLRQSSEYSGIGAVLQHLNGKLTVTQIYQNSPAEKAGLKVGDQVLKINGSALSAYSANAKQLLKGSPGSKLNLTYSRQKSIKTLSLMREKHPEKLVPYYKLIEGEIGYVVLTRFGKNASETVKKALVELKKQGATKIILDLRNNPGGLLHEAVEICNLFLPKDQLIVSTKSIIEKYNKVFVTRNKAWDLSIPLAILINGRSASASEIVAGSLQDLDRAVIIGARSFGKGLVQRPEKLPYGTQMKITVARYYTPSGRCIQALDYWHEDKNGNPMRVKPSEYTEFKTQNGRPVYDGGGISPDIKLKSSKIEGITKALLEKHAIFNYATQYYYTHDLGKPTAFVFTDEDYANFLTFLDKTKFSYETKTEKKLKLALKWAEKEGLKQSILSGYQEVLAQVDTAKKAALKYEKPAIISLLTQEIIPRYFYKEGLYTYSVQHNPEIKKAKAILTNAQAYADLLN